MDLSNQIILFVGLLFLVSITASILSARIGAPLLLVFLVIGMVLGEEGLGLMFQDIQLAHLIGSLALAVILFDGGLHTDRNNFRVGLKPAVSLATVGVLVTAVLTGLLATWVLGLPPLYGLLMGAIVGSTDAAAVFSLLHTAKLELKQRVAATLEIESGSNDPMAIFLTVVLLELILSGQTGLDLMVLFEFLRQMGLGALLGIGGGWVAARAINALPLSPGLYPLLALALGLTLFGATSVAGGSGFLAIYLAGVLMGNSRMQSAQNIRRFHNGMAWMSQIIMFLMLGLLVTPSELLPTSLEALIIALGLIFIARPIAVVISLFPFRFAWREQLFISWVGLRGAVPIILAIFPLLMGAEGASTFFNVAFFVVLVSLVLQGWSLPFVARWLQVDIPPNANMVQRVELDIPGQPEYELVGYQITGESPVLNRPPAELTLPEGVKPALLVREKRVMSVYECGTLNLGDTIYLACPQSQIALLDRVFVTVKVPGRLSDKKFFGEFVLNGNTSLEALAMMYGFPLPEDSKGHTLHSYLNRKFDRPVVGDRVRLGSIELVVRDMQGDRCEKVGLKLLA
ncbi:potassium/proton antiporter [Natronospirillum operosum]|uniref:Potassium/proton antiporter n=1 Tax=Natronospirillum operosum TaxID=2759953 RepID=A0A4Z0WIE1_9GAMM|nr:potassium/proton antiporter [Natronospirillum operosum]TGG95556.1 potassium/proton antiporter [Natronospirillum operosum]